VKRFGGREAPKQEEFELETIGTTGDPKVYQFRLTPVIQAGNVVALMDALKNEPEEFAGQITALLTKVLDDRDGVPARWAPPTLDELITDPDAIDDVDPATVMWTGPDGATYALSDQAAIEKFLDPANGSSRRRWGVLMDPRNDEGIALQDLIDIAEWVIGLSTDRPTPARASSTRPRKTRR